MTLAVPSSSPPTDAAVFVNSAMGESWPPSEPTRRKVGDSGSGLAHAGTGETGVMPRSVSASFSSETVLSLDIVRADSSDTASLSLRKCCRVQREHAHAHARGS